MTEGTGDNATKTDEIRIIASQTPNPRSLKFTVDRPVLPGGSAFFNGPEAAAKAPLAKALFDLPHDVTDVFVFDNVVTVGKESPENWQEVAKAIGSTIREVLQSGDEPVPTDEDGAPAAATEDEKKIQQVLAEIRPAVQQDGGDIIFAGYRDGVVNVIMQGSCQGCPSSTATLRMGIEDRLKQVVPDVKEVVPL